jgi:outer membrane protein, heavy metal efflux system
MKQMLIKSMCSCVLITSITLGLHAQSSPDTLRLSLQVVEKRFVDSNLVLLAAHYNVDANKALVEQAKLWDNPVLVTDQNIYAGNKFFAHGKDASGNPVGQIFIQIQQLIKTAGKRHKLIDLATTNVKLSELQLNDVLRNLRYTLRQDYFTLLQQFENKKIAENELAQMSKLLAAQDAQLKAGNIAEKDYLRIQAIVVSLTQDVIELTKSITDTESDLKTLLQIKDETFVLPTDAFGNVVAALTIDELLAVAKQNNSYYQLQQAQVLYQQQNLAYQKALKVPDVTVGPEYDHNSNYTPHYFGLSVSLPLPLLNKNQGNIKAAGYAIKQQQTIVLSTENELRNNLSNAYNKLLLTKQQSNTEQQTFYAKYLKMFSKVTESYKQRQIGLLEFLDFFDAYKDAQLRQLQQQYNLQLAKEEVNYHTGTTIIK